MRTTSPPRRVAGLLAAGATGASVVLFGFAAPAQAAPSFTASDGAAVPAGICAIDWTVVGGSGGAGSGAAGSPGGQVSVRLPAAEGDVVNLYPGGQGGAASGATAGLAGTSNGYSDSTTEGQGGASDGTVAGGGGGSASVVEQNGSLILLAFGGPGGSGGTAGSAGGSGGGGGVNQAVGAAAGSFDPSATAGSAGAGSISGTGVPCTAPLAPTGLSAEGGDGEATVYFTPTYASDSNGTDADSWQYSVDNGVTWTDVTLAPYTYYFTVPGLTNGTTYNIRVRGVSSTVGAGTASTAVSVTPATPIGAPTNVVVKPGPSSYVVTFDAPTVAGSFPVDHYVVGYDNGQSGGALCENVPTDARRCVGAALPGGDYGVSVWAVDTMGNWGVHSDRVAVGTIPDPTVPSSAPTSTDRLTVPSGQTSSVTPGKKVTLSGSGYLPNSTITLIAYSSPQVLTTVVTDATGSFTATVTVPADLEAGHHTLVASGVDSTGAVRYVTLPVTVSGGLAYTGANIELPLTGGLIALGLGAGLMVAARRRKVTDKAA